MKRSILMLLLFFGGIFTVHEDLVAANSTRARDSLKFELLRKLNRTKPGDEARLATYDELSKIVENTQTELFYIDKLLKEAQEQKNNEYICKAYMAHLVLAYNTFDVEGVNKWYNLLEPIAREEKLYDLMFRGRRGVVDMFNVTGDYEREEKEALKMLEEARALNNDEGMMAAYECLSHAYRSTFRVKEAAQILEKAYDIAYRTHTPILEINNLLIGTYRELKDQANILKWTDNLDSYLKQRVVEQPSEKVKLRGWFLLTYLAYLSYYTEERDWNHAAIYLKLAEEHKMEGYGAYENYYHLARYDYFCAVEKYESALVEVDMIINLYRELSPVGFGTMNFQKAHILQQLGRIDDALALYRRSFSTIDSIYVVTLNKQTEQLKKDYDTDQLLLRKEKIISDNQTLFLILVAIVIVILVFFVIHAYRVRKGLQKSEEEMRKMAKEMERANIAKELFLSNISTSISAPLNLVVDGSLRLASDEVQDMNERKQISQTLNKTSARLLELINSILDLSRLEASMMKFKLEDIEIVSFVQNIVQQIVSQGKEIELTLSETGKVLKVHADIVRLQEVFSNVLAAGDGSMQVSMQVLEGGASLQIAISGSTLAAEEKSTQEVAIVNEVNRLLIKHFGGKYFVKANEDLSVSVICFILPLA